MNGIKLGKSFIILLIAGISYFFFDQTLTTWVAPCSKNWHLLAKGCTLLLNPLFYLVFSLCGFVFFRLRKSPWTLPFFEILVAQGLAAGFARVFKVVIGRARPDIFIKKGVYGCYGFEWNSHFHSFPSGHSIAAFTLATSLSYLFPRYKYSFFIGAALLTFSRILLLDHYLSDVIGTAAIALVIGGGVHALLLKLTKGTLYETA